METLRIHEVDAAAVITLDRPEAGNSLSLEMAIEIQAVLDRYRARPDIRALVFTGAGDRFFCTGGDIKAYRKIETPAALEAAFSRVRDVLDAIEALEKPTVAAINGYALGGGAELALTCDLRFIASHAKFGFPQSRLGIIPGWNSTARLVEHVGRSVAMRLLYTGETLDAEGALALGLVDGVAQDDALARSLSFVGEMRSAAPLALGGAKKAVMAALRLPLLQARAIANQTFSDLWFTDDHREAERAFAEKRAPQFAGK